MYRREGGKKQVLHEKNTNEDQESTWKAVPARIWMSEYINKE